jgi:hypothetical protein
MSETGQFRIIACRSRSERRQFEPHVFSKSPEQRLVSVSMELDHVRVTESFRRGLLEQLCLVPLAIAQDEAAGPSG